MRISRPCYDKMHRCPGWAGGGMNFAQEVKCDNGYVTIRYESRFWKLKTHRCNKCDVLVLPYLVRYLDPQWHKSTWRR